jgi:hypothetical protein
MVPIAPPVQAWIPALGATRSNAERGENKADRNERVGNVKDQHQPIGKGPVTGPAYQPDDMQTAADQEQASRHAIQRARDPER